MEPLSSGGAMWFSHRRKSGPKGRETKPIPLKDTIIERVFKDNQATCNTYMHPRERNRHCPLLRSLNKTMQNSPPLGRPDNSGGTWILSYVAHSKRLETKIRNGLQTNRLVPYVRGVGTK